MYKALRVFTLGGKQYNVGERVSGLKEWEIKQLVASELIEVEQVEVKAKQVKPKRTTKQVKPNIKNKSAE